MTIEATEENLRHYYIELNTRLMDMPEIFGISYDGVRAALARQGIKKTQKQASINIIASKLAEDPEHFKKRSEDIAKRMTPEIREKAWSTRRANRIKTLEAEGASYDEVYRVFITENNSITKTGIHFSRTKQEMRKLLKFYNITKSPELIKECRETGFAELYADPERVAEISAKTANTNRERYGNNWYNNTSSKEEDSVRDAIQEHFPNLEIVQGSYGIIRRPGSGGLLQLDLYFPEIRFAVEYNGIYYHTKELYLEDLENGTMHSREALKDYLCKIEGIELIHIWSDDWKLDISASFENLAKAISAKIDSSDFAFNRAA